MMPVSFGIRIYNDSFKSFSNDWYWFKNNHGKYLSNNAIRIMKFKSFYFTRLNELPFIKLLEIQ